MNRQYVLLTGSSHTHIMIGRTRLQFHHDTISLRPSCGVGGIVVIMQRYYGAAMIPRATCDDVQPTLPFVVIVRNGVGEKKKAGCDRVG